MEELESTSKLGDAIDESSKLLEENNVLRDQYLRKSADLENYRKRVQKENQDLYFKANQQLILDVVPIIDDLDRALKTAEEFKNFDSFYHGVTLIEKQFVDILEQKWRVKRFDSIGERFDPKMHEAVSVESSDQTTSLVVEDYQKGFLLNDKVLRPAKVKVTVFKENKDV